MFSRPSIRLFLALLPGLLSGCGSSTEPGNVTKTYVLRRVAGDALPTVLATNDIGQTRIYADTLRLSSDGTGTSSQVVDFVSLGGGPVNGPHLVSSALRYRVGVNRIEIAFVCPPDANCVPPPHLLATLDDGGLEVHWGPQLSGREPLEYRALAEH